ncbi:MAG: porin [Kofleriaceae bacterium]
MASGALGALLALGAVGPARADDAAPADGDLELGGRVVVREQLAQEDDAAWTAGLALEDARLQAEYRRGKRVEVVVELGAKRNVSLKDAYLELRLKKRLKLRAGQFKLPTSALHNTSRWKLPTIDRGASTDVLDDGLGVIGRRVGAQLAWEGKGECAPRVALAAFQTTTGGGPDQGLLVDDQAGLDVVVRGELGATGGLAVGATASSRLALDPVTADRRRLWAVGVDAVTDRAVAGGQLRLWAEAHLGSLHLDATPATAATPRFVVGRALAAWRHGGAIDGAPYLEPFVGGAVMDVNLDDAGDRLAELSVGINAGRWDEWRVQLQGDLGRVGDDVPAGIVGGLSAPPDRLAVTLQLGATF